MNNKKLQGVLSKKLVGGENRFSATKGRFW